MKSRLPSSFSDTVRERRRRTGCRLSKSNVVGSHIVVLVGVGVLAAACGGNSASPRVSSLGSTTSTVPASVTQGGGSGTNYADALAYAGCMRSHGLPNFPDPTSGGEFLLRGETVNGVAGINPRSPQFASASEACLHLLPNGGKLNPVLAQQALEQELELAQCMRSHGVLNFPDPTVSSTGVTIRISTGPGGLDPNSPLFQRAAAACEKYTPGGVGVPPVELPAPSASGPS